MFIFLLFLFYCLPCCYATSSCRKTINNLQTIKTQLVAQGLLVGLPGCWDSQYIKCMFFLLFFFHCVSGSPNFGKYAETITHSFTWKLKNWLWCECMACYNLQCVIWGWWEISFIFFTLCVWILLDEKFVAVVFSSFLHSFCWTFWGFMNLNK